MYAYANQYFMALPFFNYAPITLYYPTLLLAMRSKFTLI